MRAIKSTVAPPAPPPPKPPPQRPQYYEPEKTGNAYGSLLMKLGLLVLALAILAGCAWAFYAILNSKGSPSTTPSKEGRKNEWYGN